MEELLPTFFLIRRLVLVLPRHQVPPHRIQSTSPLAVYPFLSNLDSRNHHYCNPNPNRCIKWRRRRRRRLWRCCGRNRNRRASPRWDRCRSLLLHPPPSKRRLPKAIRRIPLWFLPRKSKSSLCPRPASRTRNGAETRIRRISRRRTRL